MKKQDLSYLYAESIEAQYTDLTEYRRERQAYINKVRRRRIIVLALAAALAAVVWALS